MDVDVSKQAEIQIQNEDMTSHLLWRCDISPLLIILNSSNNCLSFANDESEINNPGILTKLGLKIQNADTVTAIMKGLKLKIEGKMLIPNEWNAMIKAIENKLVFLLLRSHHNLNSSIQGGSFSIIEIHLDVSHAYKCCSPMAIGRDMPLRPYNKQTKKISPRFYALLLLETFAELFADSLIGDVASTIFRDSGAADLDNPSKEIPARIIYQCIDNVHIDQVLKVGENPSGSLLETLDINGLRPKLRPYQEAAVRWMIKRENMNENSYHHANEWEIAWLVLGTIHDHAISEISSRTSAACITPLYEWMKTPNRKNEGILLYSPFGGWLARSYEEAKDFTLNLPDGSHSKPMISGGILADSMGLGKTVETLALILGNPCPTQKYHTIEDDDNLLSSVVRSRATLIITPPAILEQWKREISRHVDERALKTTVAIYRGVKNITDGPVDSTDRQFLHPAKLADYDIVLTTYDSLMSDLSHSYDNPFVQTIGKDSSTKALRWKKRYVVVPSPLVLIRWFRVVLDEAQRVEAPTALSAKMALQLDAVHRWCVSGTPVSRGRLHDLFGLLLFLRCQPFNEKPWFVSCLRYNQRFCIDRLGHLLHNALWRCTVSSNLIRVQLGLPEQQEVLQFLTFSSIEKHFYQRQIETTILAASSLKNQRKRRKRTKELHDLSSELRRLRAACCHPQVGSFGIEATRDKVLSMSQILLLLIDEARTSAEEAQRLTILHLIALANLNRLKGEAVNDDAFISKSYSFYVDALAMADKYCSPCLLADEEIIVKGSVGFKGIFTERDGIISLNWKLTNSELSKDVSEISIANDPNPLWCTLEFKSPKRVSGVLIRSSSVQKNQSANVSELQPYDLVLDGIINGMNVEHLRMNVNQLDALEWSQYNSLFRSLKAKIWRVRIESSCNMNNVSQSSSFNLQLKLMEMDIAVDDLQRLHIFHNLSDLISTYPGVEDNKKGPSKTVLMAEAQYLETRYLQSASSAHSSAKLELVAKSNRRKELGTKLAQASPYAWWETILASFRGSKGDTLFEFITQRLEQYRSYSNETKKQFAEFSTLDGIYIAVSSRLQNSVPVLYDYRDPACILTLSRLPNSPSDREINENSTCGTCRQDWKQVGPTCSHCKLEIIMAEYYDELHDAELSCILRSIYDWSRSHLGTEVITRSLLDEADIYFEFYSSLQKEIEAAKLLWKARFNLLSDIDEVSMCKRRQILKTDECCLSSADSSLVVSKNEIDYLINDHFSKEAMAEAQLRRKLDTVKYLKSLRQTSGDGEETCSICLNKLDSERAVLLCGHTFHLSPCLEALLNRSGGSGILCPMRCTQRTKRNEVLVATCNQCDDGSRPDQKIEGCWGTKVDRLVSDLKSLLEKKTIIFSQWDDMLDVVEHALMANSVPYVRLLSKKLFGSDINRFQSTTSSCTLLMNVKHGAEGLNLTEATHVFILEPLLSCALDRQALSRVHRIGQRNKTFVYRYIIKDTVEEKIFQRMHGASTDPVDLVQGRSDNIVNAGGLDGGIEISELEELLGIDD